jgi:UPF0755 protein
LARDRRSDAPAERTAQERERAREERERRRLAKAGASQPAPVEPPLPPPRGDSTSARALNGTAVGEGDALSVEPERVEPEEVERELIEETHPELIEEAGPELIEQVELEHFEPGHVEAEQDEPQQGEPEPVQPKLIRPEYPPRAAVSPSPQPHSHRPHLHRPHLRRPRGSRWRTRVARTAASLALLIVLGGLAAGGVLLVHHSERPKTPPPPVVVKVLIPEGYTRTQMAALAHADGLRGSYLAASKRSTQVDPARYGAPSSTPNLEGFLFPATYEMYAGAPATRLVSAQLAAFRENFGGAEIHRAKLLGVTPYQLLVVASIIEREVAIPHDRSLVAAVVYNRLRLHMTLGVDSTLRYALHDFTHPLTEAELRSDSPYNTRIHQGLPPTPISNPGVAAIKAAARPAKVSYLYYVSGSDGCGEQVFSTSYAQFEKNAAAYREAVSKNGGRVPTCKKR